METGFESLKLALVGFIIPYIFIYNPAMLLQGTFMEIVSLCFIMIYIIGFIAAGLQGFYIRKLNLLFRTGSIVIAGLLVLLVCSSVMDNKTIQVAVSVIALIHFIFYYLYKKPEQKFQIQWLVEYSIKTLTVSLF